MNNTSLATKVGKKELTAYLEYMQASGYFMKVSSSDQEGSTSYRKDYLFFRNEELDSESWVMETYGSEFHDGNANRTYYWIHYRMPRNN